MDNHVFDDFGELLSTADAAKFLKVAEGTLENWRFSGVGPSYIKVGGSPRYPWKWLRQYILDNAVCPECKPEEPQGGQP